MKMKRRFLAALLVVCLMFVLSSAAFAEDETFNAYLDVTQNPDGSISVTIPAENAAVLAQEKPTLSIPCAFDFAVVTKDGETIPSVTENGKVSFTVETAGVYTIAEAPISAFAAYTTDEAFTGSVSHIDIDKTTVHVGETVTLTARGALGYRFLGWYSVTGTENGAVCSVGDLLCGDMSYTLVAGENTAVAALYRASTETVTVTVNPSNGAQYYIDDDSALQSVQSLLPMHLGDTLRLTAADPERVLQWQNESSKKLGSGATLNLTVTGATSVTLVYAPAASQTQSYVQFVSDYGQVLFARSCAADTVIIFPDAPTKFGYSFTGWVFEDTAEAATLESIRSRIGEDNPLITVKPSYEPDQQQFIVTLAHVNGTNGQIMDSEQFSGSAGSALTLRSGSFEGLRIDRWENASGSVLGYKDSYFLQISGDAQFRAVYLPEETAAQALPVITIGEASPVDSSGVHKVSCSVTRSIPEGYTLIEHGILYARDFPDPTESSFVFGSEGVARFVSNATASSGVVKLNVKVQGDDADEILVSFRGYMLLQNASGENTYYYTDVVTASYRQLEQGGD